MFDSLPPKDRPKFAAARAALDLVEPDMRLGLGTGSTAFWLVKLLAERVRDTGMKVTCVPTSSVTAEQARTEGLTVATLEDVGTLDLTIDGADEFDAHLSLIKGGGGALLQEKIVATASDRMVVIADASKQVETLGAYPLPVEVVRFGWQSTQHQIAEMLADIDVDGREITVRGGETAFVTDEGHYILDLHLGRIAAARPLALMLNQIPGVVETGLFVDIASMVIVGQNDGGAQMLTLEAAS